MLAAQRDDIAMIVLLAGPGVDGAEIGVSQSRAMGAAAGANVKILAAQEKMLTDLFDELKRSDQPLKQEFIDKVVAQFRADLGDEESPEITSEQLTQQLQIINTPWFRFFARYDPRPTLKKVTCPVLVLNGTKDLQVLVDLNVDAIASALEEGGNEDVEVHKLENLNHLFQTTEGTGSVLEYGQIEETFAPIALEIMSDWIGKRTRSQ